MIQTTTRRIAFTEYIPQKGREKDMEAPPNITVNLKNGTINMGSKTLRILGIEGRFIKLYYENTKKIIGFTVHEILNEWELKSKKYRLVKKNASGAATISIAGIVKEFHSLTQEKYKCEVKKYIESEGILNRGTTYYYIQLFEKPSNLIVNGNEVPEDEN